MSLAQLYDFSGKTAMIKEASGCLLYGILIHYSDLIVDFWEMMLVRYLPGIAVGKFYS